MITRNGNGSIRLDGKHVDMYLLGDWLTRVYEVRTGNQVRFRDINLSILKTAINEDPRILRS